MPKFIHQTLKVENTDPVSNASFMDLFKTAKLRMYTFILSFNWYVRTYQLFKCIGVNIYL